MLGPQDRTALGALFEALVALSVQTYAQAAEATVHHVRTKNGDHEVDLLVHRNDGTNIAVEVKLTAAPDDRDVRHLLWLKAQLGAELTDMALIHTGPYAYRRTDGVAVVPLALLGP
jgi:predicted AAA+ superfamily ATPase